ncbi:hypothetical protein F5050DRAFT_1813735 [Lentinula boryana]|uniref:Uncharacterized protein n=1 Tax=Lentinula boryana TaxID=40481 RepID=A0ABQ8PW25_9AGAR|nr:hypothetical protein F5050DRAFT_1813735 [Lentinula boryana]
MEKSSSDSLSILRQYLLFSLTPTGNYFFDPQLISAIASDGGPQVCGARAHVQSVWLWILGIWDPSHNLNLYMKDIGKLFKELLSQVSGITNYFRKSNYGTWHLTAECEKQKIS